MVKRLENYDGMSKKDWKHLRCGYGENMDRQNKIAVVLERMGQGKIMMELMEEEKKLAEPLAKKE